MLHCRIIRRATHKTETDHIASFFQGKLAAKNTPTPENSTDIWSFWKVNESFLWWNWARIYPMLYHRFGNPSLRRVAVKFVMAVSGQFWVKRSVAVLGERNSVIRGSAPHVILCCRLLMGWVGTCDMAVFHINLKTDQHWVIFCIFRRKGQAWRAVVFSWLFWKLKSLRWVKILY